MTSRVQGLFFSFFSMSLLKDMLHNAVHIGSDAKHWSPAMKPYIHGTQNGIHVFDLTKTEAHLAETKKALEEFCKSGKELLIVGTKVQTQKIALISQKKQDTQVSPLSGYQVSSRTTRLSSVRSVNTTKSWRISKQVRSIVSTKKKKLWRWLVSPSQKALRRYQRHEEISWWNFVIDGHYELQAIKEANVLGITVFAILGTTGQPKLCDHFVPANVNNLKSLMFITDELAPSMKRTVRETVAEKIAKKPGAKKEETAEETPAE
jgi:small subunit ribosomal protein S2